MPPDLFSDDDGPASAGPAPLAERMRPRTLDEIVGQDGLLAPGRPLREAIERDALQSIILWGPPGTGKTTLARVIAGVTRAHFIQFSAVLSGIKEIKAVMAEAEEARRRLGRRTILFVDEIHRFNRAQQDAFLPRVEAGDIVLIGATTENPSFEVNSALLSRSKVFVLQPLDERAIVAILERALADAERGPGVEAETDAVRAIARHANGDARVALNLVELAAAIAARGAGSEGPSRVDLALVSEMLQRRFRETDIVCRYGGEEFAVILPDITVDGARVVAEKIRKAMEEASFKRKVTVSLGVAAYTQGWSQQDFVHKSDQALYQAKYQGKNRVCVYEGK